MNTNPVVLPDSVLDVRARSLSPMYELMTLPKSLQDQPPSMDEINRARGLALPRQLSSTYLFYAVNFLLVVFLVVSIILGGYMLVNDGNVPEFLFLALWVTASVFLFRASVILEKDKRHAGLVVRWVKKPSDRHIAQFRKRVKRSAVSPDALRYINQVLVSGREELTYGELWMINRERADQRLATVQRRADEWMRSFIHSGQPAGDQQD